MKRLKAMVARCVRLARNLFRPTQMRPPDPSLRRFYEDRKEFERLGGTVAKLYPITWEFTAEAGRLDGHYFNTDLQVARLISEAQPRRHIDVGSSMAFVAHVASFRDIKVLDMRPMREIYHPQITFLQGDLMVTDSKYRNSTDSLSCLSVIEHFGLGRYGDAIDPDGHLKGFANLVDMVEPGGTLYISFPIGVEDAVHFNAHRIFRPLSILNWPLKDASITLKEFSFEDDGGKFHRNVPLDSSLPEMVYGCGTYSFQKD